MSVLDWLTPEKVLFPGTLAFPGWSLAVLKEIDF